MRKRLWSIVAAALSASPALAQDDDLFSRLDANKDGYVSADEVPEAQKALFERLLRNADRDGDKKLSKDEMQAGLKPDTGPRQPLAGGPGGGRGGPGGPGDTREFFRSIDANNDGKLTKDELPPRIQEHFDRLDANSDGSISMEELGRGMMAMGQPPGARPGQPGMAMDRQQIEALFDRTDANSDGKLTKDEIPEERRGIRGLLEQAGGESLTREQFVSRMLAMQANQPPRPEGGARPQGAPDRRPEGAAERRPEGAPPRRPDGPPLAGLFNALDADRDGQLSNAEIVGAGSALMKLDRNGDGKLSQEEIFGPGGPPMMRPGDGTPPPGQRRPGQRGVGGGNPEEFRQRLKEADANGDGKISRDEAPPLLKQRFDQVDANSDGFIDEAETRQMLRRMGESDRRPEAK